MQATSTTTVPWTIWFWVGHSTFWSSAQDSPMKRMAPRNGPPRRGCASTSPAGRGPRRDGGLPLPMGASLATALTGLPGRGVLAAPAAELGELHPVGGVALRFVFLVVAPLAPAARGGGLN